MLAGISARMPDFCFESGKKTTYGHGFWVTCPNADEHTEGRAKGLTSATAVSVNERGFANFRCQHDHCQDWMWHEFVDAYKAHDLQDVITKPWLAARTVFPVSTSSGGAPSSAATVWRYTDSGNAELLVAKHGEDFKYLHDEQEVAGLGWSTMESGRHRGDSQGGEGHDSSDAGESKADRRRCATRSVLEVCDKV